uniref:Elongation factor Ts, mitochondrial n=1 Tax=Anopheles dirus TaxID=7168 RepID=A0A182NF87_9DIPT
MTETNRNSTAVLTPIDEMPAENTDASLIEMNAFDRPDTTDRIEMDVEDVERTSISEVDGRRKTRASQTQSYDIHKGIAESAMDISLLTANANQLRLLMTYNEKSHTYVACIALVIASLVMQIFVASGVIIIKRSLNGSAARSPTKKKPQAVAVCCGSAAIIPQLATAMTSATVYRMKAAESTSSSQLEGGPIEPIGNVPSGASSDGSTYDSAASEYYLALSYNGYDCFRSVVEIALSVSFLAANSNLLRLLISFKETESFIASEILVTVSIVLQILVAISIVTITQVNDPSRYAKMKACAVVGAIIISLVNLLIPFVINYRRTMTRPEPSTRSPSRAGERYPRYDRPHQHVEHAGNRGVRIFTGSEKQSKVFCNPVIFNQDATRIQPYQENDWDNNEPTPNYAADRVTNGSERTTRDTGGYDVRRSVLENALNIAFLAANSNQLRLLSTSNGGERHDATTLQAILGLIIVSLILQALNCVAMVMMSFLSTPGYSLGTIPLLFTAMNDRDKEHPIDLPIVYEHNAAAPNRAHYRANIGLANPMFGRSKSDLDIASGKFELNPDGAESSASSTTDASEALIARSSRNSTTAAPATPPPLPPKPIAVTSVYQTDSGRRVSTVTPSYDISKSIAESAMDISLLTANANQLRLLITYNQGSKTYVACITFVIMSLVLQMMVAITMIVVSLTKPQRDDPKRQRVKIITSIDMTEPIVLVLSADETVKPESIVERIRKPPHLPGSEEQIVLSTDTPGSVGYPYQIHTKYYDTQVVLCAHGSADLTTVPSAILKRTEGILIYFDAKDRTFLERLPAYGKWVEQNEIEFGILLCSSLPESSGDGITYGEAKSHCTVLDVIELDPSVEDEEATDGEATGVDELIQAMHNYIWSNVSIHRGNRNATEEVDEQSPSSALLLPNATDDDEADYHGPVSEEEERMIEAELNGFERLLTEVMNFQPVTNSWTRNERLMYAEELAEIFDNLVEEEEAEEEGAAVQQHQRAAPSQTMLFKQLPRLLPVTAGIRFYATAEKSALAALRKKTGYTFANCKKALELHNNDLAKAELWLKEQAQAMGWSKATKLEGRNTAQGLIGVLVQRNAGAMVEVNCETDFVARNVSFQRFVQVASAACVRHLENVEADANLTKVGLNSEALKQLVLEDGKSLGDHLALMIGTVGENASLNRAICYKAPDSIQLTGYVHPAPSEEIPQDVPLLGKYGSLLAFKAENHSTVQEGIDGASLTGAQVARKVCQHIVGMKPERIGEAGKDEPAADKDDETCLIHQEYLVDPSYTVGEVLEASRVHIVDFQRFECGEKSKTDEQNVRAAAN